MYSDLLGSQNDSRLGSGHMWYVEYNWIYGLLNGNRAIILAGSET